MNPLPIVPPYQVYDMVGGEETFRRLAHVFYGRVYDDPGLRPMFPADRDGAEDRLALFMMQYFGGPMTYTERNGHPRLRMRHMRFPIDQAARDAWLGHMLVAIDEVAVLDPARTIMREYVESASTFLLNRPD